MRTITRRRVGRPTVHKDVIKLFREFRRRGCYLKEIRDITGYTVTTIHKYVKDIKI